MVYYIYVLLCIFFFKWLFKKFYLVNIYFFSRSLKKEKFYSDFIYLIEVNDFLIETWSNNEARVGDCLENEDRDGLING